MRRAVVWVGLLLVLPIIGVSLSESAEHQEHPTFCSKDKNNGSCVWKDKGETSEPPAVPPTCQLVMAPSTLESGIAGWGIFTTTERRKGRELLYGDIAIQLIDLDINPYVAVVKGLLRDYLWSAEETGGLYEARHVVSVMTGVGMLANGLAVGANVLPFVPTVDEGGLTRQKSHGAGAISHYHNFSFYVSADLAPGQEIFCNYGKNWFLERKGTLIEAPPEKENASASSSRTVRSVHWLRQNGRCLDNMVPGRSRKTPGAGRGAFAARRLPQGSIVAPVPVLAIADRRVLDIPPRERQDGSFATGLKQLLINYCFGHPDSPVLLYPYAPGVNLINHGPRGIHANVELRWSAMVGSEHPSNVTIEDLVLRQPMRFLLELVATRDIESTEEIFLDYGDIWIEAWLHHQKHWKPPPEHTPYVPSFVVEDAVKSLRTQEELAVHPYPDNVFTSCFYRYSDHVDEVAAQSTTSDAATTSVRWEQTRSLFDLQNLRPCHVLQRQQDPKMGTVFTVQIRNRYGLSARERLPKDAPLHIVTHVPRHAIRFSDKLYTSDQHLEGAFRHEIGLPDGLFPDHWKHLLGEKVEHK
jgi:hypothetical protein